MKKYTFLIIFVLSVALANAQDYTAIDNAFSEGNASGLSKAFDSTVELSIDGKTSTIGRSDAENRMRSFFLENEPRNFEIVHKGESQSDVHYFISQLVTSSGTFRITAYLHKSIDKYLIQSLEIEKD